MRNAIGLALSLPFILGPLVANGQSPHPFAAERITSLTNPEVKYRVAAEHYFVATRGDITAIFVDNAPLDFDLLPGHRGGYNGVASLTHRQHPKNLFVPSVAGLNFEHIHDGTAKGLQEKFEPRKFPMQLRIIDDYVVELYQPPTGNWQLESCGRYELLADGVIEYTFECIPRAGGYRHNYIGLFWASYIEAPENKAIHFLGRHRASAGTGKWIEAITPEHGLDSTHGPAVAPDLVPVDDDFPLRLVHHPSNYVYTDPWYFGVSHGMAFVQMFRARDRVWLAQSPSGGGRGNPAWDFQWFIPDYQVGEAYGFRMRAAYLPWESRQQIELATRKHREALRGSLPD